MRIALLYPPPWKIPESGEPPDPHDGPPDGYIDGDLDGDFHQTPYGLLTLAAQAIQHGHQVKVINLSAYPWSTVDHVVASLDAQLFGLSCWTANRRGAVLTAEAIKKHHPQAHVLMGGPHASPLAEDMLRHYDAIDTIAVNETELTFLELIERLHAGADIRGLPGAVYRDPSGNIARGAKRRAVDDLDTLVSIHDYFDTHIVMTSRGCPWACTFCGAESQWGRGFRSNSVDYTLDAIEKLVERLPVKMVMVKDDTFTTNKKRVIALCRGIRERNIRVAWSCDTRVDLLTEELLYEMRLAGCERLSLGVESGAPEILAQVDKKITTDDILRSTELAKSFGIKVRYFMMLGNRGETVDTFQQTLDFLDQAQPHDYIFSCLSIYPGTRDFSDAEQQGWLDREVFFSERFQELKVPFDADDECTAMMNAWFKDHSGLQRVHTDSVDECKATLVRLGDHAPAHLDLAGAHFAANEIDDAQHHARKAIELGHPLPGLALNYLACIAVDRGDYDAMMDLYSEAAKTDPQHAVLIRNVERARKWFREEGPSTGIPLELDAQHDFRLLERTTQPTLPGPLADDFADWSAAPKPCSDAAVAPMGSKKALGSRKQLKLL